MMKDFGYVLREMRKAAGLSQREVSTKLGYTTPQFVSNWERGICMPPVKTLKRIAELYDASGDHLFKLCLDATIEKVKRDFETSWKRRMKSKEPRK